MRRAVAVCFLWLVSIAQDTGDAERIDFSTTLVNRVSSDEEVVQGTISLNGTITPESVSKLNWAAQNALVQACGHGSKVIANAVLQLSWVTRRGVDIKFFVLPRLGGGGDCARTLVEGSAGAFEPPFQVSGALRKPIFRNMMQNELELLGFGALMSDMYLRLWRITCDVQPVWRNGNSLTEQNPVTICGTYASGWEVYFEPSITEPATAVGVSLGYSAGNTGSVAQQFSDKCMVANSPCFCSSMSSCGWRRKEDGVGMHCKTLDSSDTATPVTCDACAQQPGCPPSCSSASYPCHCASIEATCRWDVTTGVCLEGPAPNGEDVPCSSCSLQDRCQALRPRALEFRPNSIFALTREGPKSLIEVDFNVALALPAVAARAAARFLCGTDGFDPLANSLQLLEYVVPPEALLVEGRTLKLASGTVQVVEPTRCTLILSGGVVSSRDDGLPSQPVEFGEYYFNMKDSVPPQVAAFWPANGAGSVPTVTQWITISFSERIRATESFEALLTRTDVMGEPADPPVAVSLHSVHQRTMTLAIQGLLGPGRFYQLTISDKSIIDYGSLAFEGITAGAYKFKTEGTYEEVQVIEAPAESLPGAAIAGIVGGAVVLLLTALFLCYRGYIAASEKDDLVHVIEQDDNNKKKNKKEKSNEPPAIFGSDAIRDMQIDQLPETPDNRKQGAVLFAFDEDGEDPLRKAAAMEEGTTRTNRRVSRASLRAEAFAEAHPELSQGLPGRPSVASNQPTNERHGHHHSNERSGRHGSNEHSGRHGSNERSGHHSNERGSNERSGHHGSNERSGHHSNERSNRPSHGRHSVHSNQVPEDVRPPTSSKKEEPKKEPPKMKPGFFLGAWDG